MAVIKKTYFIAVPISQVWQALVDPIIIEKWGAGAAKMDEEVGSEFSLWGGDVNGKNIEVIAKKKLVQEWFGGKWDNPSIVTIELFDENGNTKVELTQEKFPEKEQVDLDKGWDNYYFEPMKALLEKEE